MRVCYHCGRLSFRSCCATSIFPACFSHTAAASQPVWRGNGKPRACRDSHETLAQDLRPIRLQNTQPNDTPTEPPRINPSLHAPRHVHALPRARAPRHAHAQHIHTTRTPTLTRTAIPVGGMNELLPRRAATGTTCKSNVGDEYIEIINRSSFAINVNNWRLDTG